MSDFHGIALPSRVYAGERAAEGVAEVLRGSRAERVALFCDRTVWDLGLAEGVERAVADARAALLVSFDVSGEPTCSDVERATAWFEGCWADAVVAVGGGSVMDAAKLVGVLAGAHYTLGDLLEGSARATRRVPTAMVPTTAGTGAEATPNAVVTVPESGLKAGVVSPALMADAVVLDPSLVMGMPAPVAAATGADALCHAVECATSARANPLSDVHALSALRLVMGNLRASCAGGDREARAAMQLGAFLAGSAIAGSGTTAAHALSYPLGARHHVPHGVACALLLVPVLRYNLPAVEDALARCYDECRLDLGAVGTGERARAFVDAVERLLGSVDLPGDLAGYGVREGDLDDLVEGALRVRRLLDNNRREVTPEAVRAIFAQALRGGAREGA